MSISLAVTSPGAIPDRDALIAAVNDWLDRDDLDAKVPMFIQMAEAYFDRELRVPQMERTVTGAVTNEDTALPEDYLAMRAVYIEGSPDLPLRAMSPSSVRQEYDGTTGTPEAYILVSGGIRFVPPPDETALITMDYFARIDPLSVAAPSNWLLQQHPDAYLAGALFNAEIYLDNERRAAQWKGLLDQIIARVNKSARSDRYGAGPIARLPARQVGGSRC